MGVAISSTFRNVTTALQVAPMVMLPFILFGGFLIPVEDVPIYVRWFTWISPVRYGMEGAACETRECVALRWGAAGGGHRGGVGIVAGCVCVCGGSLWGRCAYLMGLDGRGCVVVGRDGRRYAFSIVVRNELEGLSLRCKGNEYVQNDEGEKFCPMTQGDEQVRVLGVDKYSITTSFVVLLGLYGLALCIAVVGLWNSARNWKSR